MEGVVRAEGTDLGWSVGQKSMVKTRKIYVPCVILLGNVFYGFDASEQRLCSITAFHLYDS